MLLGVRDSLVLRDKNWMKKFLVLNQNYQPMSPVAFGFKKKEAVDPTVHSGHTPADNLIDTEGEARQFAEHLGSTMLGQSFHLVEIKATARAKPPIEWT